MAWQRGAKKEIGEGWKWMRKQNPDAAAEAEHWAEEHKEDMKEVDRTLYRSDESYYGKTASLELEDAESMRAEGDYHDPDAFLPEDVRDRIYDDHTYVKIRIPQRIQMQRTSCTCRRILPPDCMI